MKKFAIVLTVLLLCTAASTSAQNCLSGGLNASNCLSGNIGLSLGWNSFNMTGDGPDGKYDDIKRKSGFLFGGFYEYKLMKDLFIMPHLLLTRKGIQRDWINQYDAGASKLSAADAATASLAATLTYIQLPVLFKYVFPMEGKFKPHVVLGPSLAIKISAKEKAEGWEALGLPAGSDGEFDIINAKKMELSGIIGAGVSFLVGDLMMGVDFRYDKGLTSVFDDVTQDEANGAADDEAIWTGTALKGWDAKNSGFSISLSMILPIGAGKSDDDGN